MKINVNNIVIEQMKIEHIDDVIYVDSSCNHSIISKKSLIEDLNSDNKYYIIARYLDETIGFAGISLLVDHADIICIATSKDYLKQNVATTLLNNIILKCNELNFGNVFLEVRKSNIPAINLYKKVGFAKISERKNYYPDSNEDAFMYIYNLKK